MNLAILIGHFPPGAFGGAELQAEAWARRLAARHRVTVVTRRVPHGLPPSERRDVYEIVRLPVSRVPLLRTAVDLNRIARAVGAIGPRPDLMLCFQTFASGLAGVRAQRRRACPRRSGSVARSNTTCARRACARLARRCGARRAGCWCTARGIVRRCWTRSRAAPRA